MDTADIVIQASLCLYHVSVVRATVAAMANKIVHSIPTSRLHKTTACSTVCICIAYLYTVVVQFGQ
jgi:hypothetical protein